MVQGMLVGMVVGVVIASGIGYVCGKLIQRMY
jgi:hypothetical protein